MALDSIRESLRLSAGSKERAIADPAICFSTYARLLGASVYGRQCPSDLLAAKQGFQELTQIYPQYCDHWLGLMSLGCEDGVFEHLYATRHNVGQLQKLCDMNPKLSIQYFSGLYMNFTAMDEDEIALAYLSWLIRKRRWLEAHEVIQNLVAHKPQWLELLWVRVVLSYHTGRWNEVISLLSPHSSQFDAFDPFFKQAFTVVLGISLAKLNMGLSAIKYLEHAAGPIEDAYFDGEYARALVLRSLDKKDEALFVLNELFAKYPQDKNVLKAISDPTMGISVTSVEKITARTDPWDITTEPDDRTLQYSATQELRNTLLAKAELDLSRFIGIMEVKDQVQRLKGSVVMALLRKKRGLGVSYRSHHLVFAGPPGTGKTTIARVIAKIYCGLGIITNDFVTEVVRSDLVGQHIGETEAKTNAVIDRALDGVLFLDEAYTLVSTGSKNDFGLVAVDTLLARMENDRDRLIVIIAGYFEELQLFLNSNEGLRSRFARTIEFTSYSPQELLEMAVHLGQSRDSVFDKPAQEYMLHVFDHLCNLTSHDDDDKQRKAIDIAGNGRFVRNLVERSEENREHRLNQLHDHSIITDEQLMTVELSDVQLASFSLIKGLGLPDIL